MSSPIFFSQLSKMISLVPSKVDNTNGGNWKRWVVSNASRYSVKKDEILWSGIADYFDSLDKQKISKNQVLDYLVQNNVEVTEVTKGDIDAAQQRHTQITKVDVLAKELFGAMKSKPLMIKDQKIWSDELAYALLDGDVMPHDLPLSMQEPAVKWIDEYKNLQNFTPVIYDKTKYEKYQLLGGENYRELLLILPEKKFETANQLRQRFQILDDQIGRLTSGAEQSALIDEREKLRPLLLSANTETAKDSTYRTNHWEESNVLAHIRFNDRVDMEGNKVLFIEELQSDWGQTGKKQGFGYKDRSPLIAEEDNELMSLFDQPSRTANQTARMHELNNRLNASHGKTGIPDAPFVTKTESWLQLGIKRMIRYAAENGYDKVAFVSGEQSAARYDLSKSIKEINYEKDDSGNYEINAIGHDGREVFNEDEVSIDRIEELAGKEIAKKIIALEGERGDEGGYRDWRTLSGLDLRVGGEGMKTFYDQIVPQVIGDLLKKMGESRAETLIIRLDNSEKARVVDLMDGEWAVEDSNENVVEIFLSESSANKYLLENKNNFSGNAHSQIGFTMTDSLRSVAMNGLPMFSREEETNSNWYYSQLSKSIEDAPDRVFGAPKQVAMWLDSNAGKLGVKKGEIQWTGVADWLNIQTGKVSKADVLDYLRGGGVKVQEVMKGKKTQLYKVELDKDDSRFFNLINNRTGEIEESHRSEAAASRAMAEYEADRGRLGRDVDDTKYKFYQLPGGDNYRELLLTLPDNDNRSAKSISSDGDTWRVELSDGSVREFDVNKANDKTEALQYAKKIDNKTYSSNHWDEKNILAHIRFNDRIDTEGNKVLFIEELQSDWAQEGLKNGFNVRPTDKISNEQSNVRRVKTSLLNRASDLSSKSDDYIKIQSEIARLDDKLADLAKEWNTSVGKQKTPNAPFVTKTESWLQLGIKRMISYAVEHGYDKVAFVSGAQSAARYDLSKKVDALTWKCNSDGTFDFEVMKDDLTILSNRNADANWLEDHVGKEFASKVVKDEYTSILENSGRRFIDGNDLKLGGEGMKIFYDQIVPQNVNAILKNIGGGRVEQVDIAPDVLGSQNGFFITEAMRDMVRRGLPLFAREEENLPSNEDSPEFKTWFGDSKVLNADGKPLVVYHGTYRWEKENGSQLGDISAFDRLASVNIVKRGHSIDTVGSWFSDNHGKQGAEMYGNTIYPVYLNIKNPYVTTFDQMVKRANQLAGFESDKKIGKVAVDALRYWLKETGRDGIHITGSTTSTEFDQQSAWIALEPEQIKSTIGNNGQYDINNPDIRFSSQRQDERDLGARESSEFSLTPRHEMPSSISALIDDLESAARKDGLFIIEAAAMLNNPESAVLLAIRQGEIDPDGAYFSTNGSSTYFDPLNDKAGKYDLSGLRILDTSDQTQCTALIEEALLDDSLDKTGRERLQESLREAKGGAPYVGYQLADETPLAAAGRRLDFDGMRVTENDDWSNPSSVFIWNVDKVKQLSNEEFARLLKMQIGEDLDWARQAATEGFENWFGNSKVLDDDGGPLVVYHGSDTDFNIFDMSKSVDGAHWFTPNELHAESFGEARSFYIQMDNPLVIDQAILELAWDKEHPDGEQDDRSLLPRDFVEQFVLAAKQNGNDGLIIRDMGDRDIQSDMYLPFKPNQIKSATENNGDFNVDNTDIRYLRDEQNSRAFENWFENSKVLGADGKPLVVYHGTKEDFSEFNRTKSGEFGPAIYFTDNVREASEYADGKGWGGVNGASVMPTYLRICHPYTDGVDAFWKAFSRDDGDANAIQRAQDAGYDGVIATRSDRYYDNEAHEYVDRGDQLTHYIVFNQNQIKSAIGNNGEYNINNPDIRFLRDQKEKNDRIYMPEANRSQLIYALYDEARDSAEGKRLLALEGLANKYNSDRFDQLCAESLRLLKEKFTENIEMFSHLDDRQIKSFANQLFMDQARENLPEDKTIDKRDARAVYIDYLNDYVNQRVPEGSPFVDSANQRKMVEDTDNFKQWFVGSQAIDSDGKPLIGFHGTRANEFTQFAVGSNRKNGDYNDRVNPNHSGELGSWFALPSKYNTNYEEGGAESVADGFAGGVGLDQYPEGARIVPVYLSITNPAEFEGYEHFQEGRNEFESLSDFKQHLIKAGHNGIVIRNSDTDGNDDRDDWVAFSSEQIKSAIGNDGEYSINNPDIRFSVETDSVDEIDERITLANSTWYYSQLERQITRAPDKMDGAPALQWVRWLEANAGKVGIKKEEIQWSGVTDWLKLQTGKVLKSDISNYLRFGGIEIQEVLKGGTSERGYDVAADAVNAGIRNRLPDDEMARLREIRDNLRDKLSEPEKTKYPKHQLLGGENYRELLLVLPNPKKSKELDSIDAQIRLLSNWPRAPGVAKKPEDQEHLDQLCQEWDAIDRVSTYQSSHWTEANVIAHIRFNDRIDDEGNKVLFIEELQSDWAQDGLKKGFSQKQKLEVRKDHSEDADEDTYEVLGSGAVIGYVHANSDAEAMKKADRSFTESRMLDGISAAPFVTKTESWLQLGIKRMIRYAAEHGYDKVAFIDGQQSAERFDLSKQVSKIMATKAGSDFHIYGTDLQGNTKDFGVHSPNKLKDVVGKDLAEKIIVQQTPNDVYKGNDLMVGGSGMKAFYDNIVPQAVNDVLKKLDSEKITTARVNTRDPYDSGVIRLASNGNKFWLERERTGDRLSKDFDSYIAADDERDTLYTAESKGMTTQACFDITSHMREQIMQGQPLFRRDDAAPDTVGVQSSTFKAWFDGSKVVDANGIPLVAYHGTTADITQFEGNEIAGWFSENPTMASEKYTNRETFDEEGADIGAPNVMPVYLSIKKPLILDFDMNDEDVIGADIYKRFGLSTEKVQPDSLLCRDFAWEVVNDCEFELAAHNAGYDGIEVMEGGVKTWAIFGPNQAKSAIGNRGQYNPENPDIRFFRAPVKKSTARATLKTELDTVKKLAEFFGSKVGVVRLAEQSPFKFKGVHYNGTIWLNEASTKPLHAVFGHELLHAMKQERPDLYKGLCDAVTPMLKDQTAYVEKTRLSAYSSDYVREEMIADLVGDRFTEHAFWKKVADHDASMFSGIAHYVTGKLDALRGLLTKKDATLGSGQFVTDLDAAREAIAKTVATYAKDKKNNEQRNGYFGAFESPLKKWLTPSLTKKDITSIATKLIELIDDEINVLYCAETGREPNYGAVFEWLTVDVPKKTPPDKALVDLIRIAIARGDATAERYRHVTISAENTTAKKAISKKCVVYNSSNVHVGEP